MGKALTVKDVLYALQFGGQLPAGTKVPSSVAEQARTIHSKESGNA